MGKIIKFLIFKCLWQHYTFDGNKQPSRMAKIQIEQKKLSFLVSCLIILVTAVSCSKQTMMAGGRSQTYRAPVSPLESAAKILTNPHHSMTLQQTYIAWQVEHDNLTSSLNHSHLAMLEAHRRTVGHLKNIIRFYPTDRMLHSYLELYSSLLAESERNPPPRVIKRKYKILKQQIQKLLLGH